MWVHSYVVKMPSVEISYAAPASWFSTHTAFEQSCTFPGAIFTSIQLAQLVFIHINDTAIVTCTIKIQNLNKACAAICASVKTISTYCAHKDIITRINIYTPDSSSHQSPRIGLKRDCEIQSENGSIINTLVYAVVVSNKYVSLTVNIASFKNS